MTRRSTIKLSPDHDLFLRRHHRQSGVPDGQFPQRPVFWRRFTDQWNAATDRDDTPEEVLHYITTRRKRPRGRPGRWDPFGDDYLKLKGPEESLLREKEWKIVADIYLTFDEGSDNMLYDTELRTRFLLEFANRTGRHLPPLLFTAALVARRKDGKLPTLNTKDGDLGFGDMDEIA